jgi:hypothetical protein
MKSVVRVLNKNDRSEIGRYLLNRNWVHSPPLAASYILRFIKPRSAKRLVAVMPRRGLSAGDGVEGLPRGGKQRAQIFTSSRTLRS